MSKSLRWFALAVVVLAELLVTIDATVLGLAIPFLSEDLHPSNTQLLWIADVYSFVMAGLLISMGSVGDRFGRKRMLLIGAAGFGLISVLNAYATSPELLILARALLGVAGAALLPATLAMVRTLFDDPAQRSFAIGVWGAMASVGMAIGPLLGGVLLEHFWWGSVFLINLPVMVLVVPLAMKLLPESRNPNPARLDPGSVALSMIGLVGVVYAIKEAAQFGARLDVLVAAVLGIGGLFWFVRRQLRLPNPLLDVRLFANRGFTGAVLADLFSILGLGGTVFFLSQYLQMVQGRSPLQAGLIELPVTVGAVITGLLAGQLARRSAVRVIVAGGLVLLGLALGGMCLFVEDTSVLFIGIQLFVLGAGAGLAFTVTADIILSSVPTEQAGAASAVSETAYELGGAFGIALLGSALSGVYRGFPTPSGVPRQLADSAHSSLGNAITVVGQLPERTGYALLGAARSAFLNGLQLAAGLGAILVLGTAVAAWFLLRRQRLHQS
ncbi:MFS transporter [Sciscionella marina]|uniref:MFS transporter n=1 Tax=Sciscionella marina TaxID=508770 RepID=UPI000360247E|nr:MFS transporter [Sciscionella marina]